MKGIGEILGLIFGAVSKNPLIAKMLFFTIFVSVITFALSFLKDLVSPYLVSNNIFAIAGYFGVLDGLNVYITIVVSGFGVKQVLAFIRS